MGNRPDPIRVVIVDEHESVRDGIRKLLTISSGVYILGEASDVTSGASLANRLQPDIVLLGSCLAGQNGTVALGRDAKHWVVPTIVMLSSADRPKVLQAFQLGARGIISNVSAPGVLLECILAVIDGHYWLDNESVTIAVNALREFLPNGYNDLRTPKDYGLTPRELDVVTKVANGRSNKEISREFDISERTVKHHLTNIFVKLGVSSRLELAVFAVNHDVIKNQTSAVAWRAAEKA